jgi:hypothetical protein
LPSATHTAVLNGSVL